jgi:tRNA (cytidine/uridine-2'-O-)-methyltransferase
VRLALHQPDIAQNVGTLMRLAACMGVALDVIEPCGFPFDDRRVRRSAMDYMVMLELARHSSWAAFRAAQQAQGGRLVLLTTRAGLVYTDVAFRPDDVLLAGSEGAGVPDEVHRAADLRVLVPMRPGLRSLNVAVAAAMVLGEALRQTGLQPGRATEGTET